MALCRLKWRQRAKALTELTTSPRRTCLRPKDRQAQRSTKEEEEDKALDVAWWFSEDHTAITSLTGPGSLFFVNSWSITSA